MIAINCTHCQQRLEMDEAFAGGVCRCQYCGTIQTVPLHLKKANATSTAPAKTVHPAGGSGTGLDELAEVVASSGLARSSLAKKSSRGGSATPARTVAVGAAPAAPPSRSSATVDYPAGERERRSPMVPVFIGISLLTVLGLGAAAYFGFVRTSTGGGTAGAGGSGTGGAPSIIDIDDEPDTLTIPGPAFADVSLENAKTVVYLLDRSQANADVLDHLKAAIYYSVVSLGPQRKFQILFWSHKSEGIVAYPETGLAPATVAEVDAAFKAFENVIGYDNTELKPTLERAMTVNPDAIVIATAKGLYLEEDTLVLFDAALQGTLTRVYAFSLGETESPVLKEVAEKTGGRYREISQTQLKKLRFHLPKQR